MKKLIVNADGFGFGPGATAAILNLLGKTGFIKSVSVNANFPDAGRLKELVRDFPSVSVGVHLNPMVGRPCLQPEAVPSLVGADGFMHGRRFPGLLRRGRISMEELEMEFDAQISRVKELAGGQLTHIDSQANGHLAYLGLFLRLADKWKISKMRTNSPLICLEAEDPARARLRAYTRKPHVWLAHKYRRFQMRRARARGMKMADGLISVGYAGAGNKTNPENWERILKNLPDGVFEIYCHPAYPDSTLRRWAVYCEERAEEAAILGRKWLARAAQELGVEVINFNDI